MIVSHAKSWSSLERILRNTAIVRKENSYAAVLLYTINIAAIKPSLNDGDFVTKQRKNSPFTLLRVWLSSDL